jgi:hypothetical protein
VAALVANRLALAHPLELAHGIHRELLRVFLDYRPTVCDLRSDEASCGCLPRSALTAMGREIVGIAPGVPLLPNYLAIVEGGVRIQLHG